MNRVGHHFREYRAKENLPQWRLAEMLGVKQHAISMIENGQFTPSLRLATKFARLANVSLDEMFVEEVERC